MRIAMVGPFGFHPNKTMRSRAFRLARSLAHRGHEVGIFMPPWQTPEEAGRQWEESGVLIRYVGLSGGVPGTTARLVRAALAFQPDVVHCFKPKAYSGLVAWWLWQTRRRSLHLVTDSDDWEGAGGWNEIAPYRPWQKRFFARQEQWGLRHCHSLTVASKALQSLAWAHGVPADKVHYIPNGPGIEPAINDAAEKRAALGLTDRPVLLLYSRLFEFDVGYLAIILRQVKEAVPDLAILSVGAGLYEEQARDLRGRLETAGLLPAFVDVGWVTEEALPSILAAADVGLYLMADTLLNRTKCPVKLADMAVVGVPVVAENVGQVPEYIIHNRTGLLRMPGDAAGVVADLVLLLQDKGLRRPLADGARAHMAANYTWDRLAEQLLTAYRSGFKLES